VCINPFGRFRRKIIRLIVARIDPLLSHSLLAWIPIERWLPNQRRARSRICAPIPDR
jgi:hypothetical protein